MKLGNGYSGVPSGIESPGDDGGRPRKKLQLKAVVVNVDEQAEAAARDAAERALTETPERVRGVLGFAKRIWKHAAGRELYRQKYLSAARKKIKNEGNIFSNEEDVIQSAHAEAMAAVIERFSQEYDETLHAGTERRVVGDTMQDHRIDSAAAEVKATIREHIRQYAAGAMSDSDFTEAKNRALRRLAQSEQRAKEESMYADNLLIIAQQAKEAVEHGESLDQLDFEMVLGRAKDNIDTQAKYNAADQLIERAKKTKLGVLVNESTLANVVAISTGVYTGLIRRAASSRLAAIGTIGASATLGGVLVGMAENKRLKEDRRQHAREMAQGRTYDKSNAPRRAEMDKYLYDMKGAVELTTGLQTAFSAENLATPEGLQRAAATLAAVEARIQLMDREKIDLIAYSDPTKINQERFALDMARAKAKVALKDTFTVEQRAEMTSVQVELLTNSDDGIKERDRLFNKMKRLGALKSGAKGVGFGLLFGAAAQEVVAFFNSGQTGILEHATTGRSGEAGHVTAFEGLREYLFGAGHVADAAPTVATPDTSTIPESEYYQETAGMYLIESATAHEQIITIGETRFTVPENYSVKTDGILSDPPRTTFSILKDGTSILGHIPMNSDGTLSPEGMTMLQSTGIGSDTYIDHIIGATETAVPAAVWAQNHPEYSHQIARDGWYDNNTPKPTFDLNELKLWWSGDQNSAGINKDGNIELNVLHMTEGGSFHGGLSTNAQELAKEGKLMLLLSLSQDSQAHPIEVPIDINGKVVIDPNGEIGKLLFSQEGGKANFLGRFAEVAQMTGNKDGIDHVKILATLEGKGIDSVPETVPQVTDVPEIRLTPPAPEPDQSPIIDPIPIIPYHSRKPLEPVRNGPMSHTEAVPNYYGYYGSGGIQTLEQKEKHRRERSPRLQENPNAELDPREEIREYFARQDPTYLKKVDALASQVEAMEKECELAICIPVAGHQEAGSIERTLSSYLNQTSVPESFEVVLFVNQPDKTPTGARVKSDGTLKKALAFKKAHPELNIRIMQAILPISEARIGNIRKLLTDATLRRFLQLGSKTDLVLVSNDADNHGVVSEYVENYITKFNEHRETDAMTGQFDWDPKAYIRNPLIHIGTRLFQYDGVQSRAHGWHFNSSGANFGFKSSIYAGVGGYDDTMKGGEDTDFGAKITEARMGATEKKPIAYAGPRSRLYTSARRAEMVMKKHGLAPIEQWDKGFGAFDDEVRKVNWETNGETVDYTNKEVVKNLVNALEVVMNRTIKRSSQWGGSAGNATLHRSLNWLGIKYTIVDDHSIQITDASKLIKGLAQYQKEGLKILEKKTARPIKKIESKP